MKKHPARAASPTIRALHQVADELMCDEDNDRPCGTRKNDPRPGETCNPCSIRFVALKALEAVGDLTPNETQVLRGLRKFYAEGAAE